MASLLISSLWILLHVYSAFCIVGDIHPIHNRFINKIHVNGTVTCAGQPVVASEIGLWYKPFFWSSLGQPQYNTSTMDIEYTTETEDRSISPQLWVYFDCNVTQALQESCCTRRYDANFTSNTDNQVYDGSGSLTSDINLSYEKNFEMCQSQCDRWKVPRRLSSDEIALLTLQ